MKSTRPAPTVLFWFLALLLIAPPRAWAQFSGAGSGTENDPYQITTVAQLDEVRNAMGAHYRLMNALDLAGTPQNDEGGDGWEPISIESPGFTGTFDGGGYTISNLFINKPDADRVGLFGYLGSGGVVTKLGVVNVNVTGGSRVGAIVGFNSAGAVNNSYSSGSVSGTDYVGGVVGTNSSAVANCYSTASVSGASRVGGLAGIGGTISNSYSTGAVTGTSLVGGLVGSTGSVSGSFWDTETSGQAASSGGTGRTTAQMKALATFTDTATPGLSSAWDFVGTANDDAANEDLWDLDLSGTINNGYPYLSWQDGAAVSLPVELVSFTATLDGTDVLLRWATASETNNAGFSVERLHATSLQWHALDFVAGHGTTTEAQAYALAVTDLAPGVHRFRLKQVDYDGRFEYSPEVEVAVELAEVFHLSAVYPNPFRAQTAFTLAVRQAQHVQVALYDVLGRRVKVLYDGMLDAEGMRRFEVDGRELPGGTYLVRLTGEAFKTTRRVMLIK